MKLTRFELMVEGYITAIPRFESFSEDVIQSLDDIPVERREQLLRNLCYMVMKCEAWANYWGELRGLIESQPLIKRVK